MSQPGGDVGAPARDYPLSLFPQHVAMLKESGVTPEHARLRGYMSVDTRVRLKNLGITSAGQRVPGLLVPMRRKDGTVWGYQYRPDSPRSNPAGKEIKYETPRGQRNGVDVPPGVGPSLGDPKVPLWVTEGVKKADCAAIAGLACVALPGVWSWRGRNEEGGLTAIPDWEDVALNGRRVILAFDSDVVVKASVRQALLRLARYLESKGAQVAYCHLPNDEGGKTGLDDYLGAGHTAEDLWKLVRPDLPEPSAQFEPAPTVNLVVRESADRAKPITLAQAESVFVRWFGAEYDLDALRVCLAAAAVERLDGDPLWLLLVSGSGNAKTETVQALVGAGALLTSSITSEGALLSATSKNEVGPEATGGLLRKIGARGLLVIKDVTSILSMNREVRAQVLGALREVYDGRWSRQVGTDGGRTLEWAGRLVIVGAVTTAWDAAHAVIASMGDRFVLLRTDSTRGRVDAGRRAISNTGAEDAMRAELAATMAGVLAGMTPDPAPVTKEESEILLAAADLVTLARTGVEYDYRGDVIDAHAPEMPTRFAKQLAQVLRGGAAVGIDRTDALRLAVRCARDSLPPLRLAVIDDLAAHPDSITTDVRKRLNKPRATIDRQLQALHMLGVLRVEEEATYHAGKPATAWRYRLADDITPDCLNTARISARNVSSPPHPLEGEEGADTATPTLPNPTDISGTDGEPAVVCTVCGEGVQRAALAGGFTTHPGCDLGRMW